MKRPSLEGWGFLFSMVAYNFKIEFVPLLESGAKLQTIREKGRKRHARPGEIIQMYTGMRTPHCRLIMVRPCLEVLSIQIGLASGVWVDGCLLQPGAVSDLAIADGFASTEEFISFFKRRMPFDGFLIKWSPNP